MAKATRLPSIVSTTVDSKTVTTTLETLLGDDELQTINEIDAVLRAIVVDQNGQASARQLAYFSRLGWDVSPHSFRSNAAVPNLLMQIARMGKVIRCEQIGGTKEARAALAKEVQRTADELATRSPEITAQIEKLTSELNALERAATSTARRNEEACLAALQLRQHVPAEIKLAADMGHSIYSNSSEHRAFLDAEAEYRNCVAWNENAAKGYQWGSHVSEADWAANCAKAQRDLSKITAKYEAAKIEHDAACEEQCELLDFYVV